MKPTPIPILFAVIVVCAALLWLPPLTSSLWLDELDTFFSAHDGVVTAVTRTLTAHPQCSVLYNVLIAIVITIFGESEAVLRLPSLLATIVAAFYVTRIGARWVDKEYGLLAALAFIGLHDVAFAAVDARSYAPATAAATIATFHLLRFVEGPGRLRDGIVYAVAAAVGIHFHYLFALVLVPQALFVLALLARGEPAFARRDAVTVATTLFVTAVPAVWPVIATIRADQVPSYAPPPNLFALLSVWARPEFVVSVVPIAAYFLARGRAVAFALPKLGVPEWILLIAWAIFPPAFVFFVSELATFKIFLARYFLCAEPGIALLLALLLRSFEPPRVRVAAAGAYALVTIIMYARAVHVQEDWRGLAALLAQEVEADTPVLVNAGFSEAAKADWLELPNDDDRRRFLLAPLEYYSFPGSISLLPYALTPATQSYVERVVVPRLEGVERFACVWRQRREMWARAWFDARYASAGYVARELWKSAALNAVIYERAPR